MKSRSVVFMTFVSQVDDILTKVHARTVKGIPITSIHDEWNDARERLMAVKVSNRHFDTWPITWTMADQLILDELASRENACEEHRQLKKGLH